MTWASRPERGSSTLLDFMLWLVRHGGLAIAELLLYPIALYFFLVVGEARRASAAYLTRVLGRPPRLGERFRHFLTFAMTILDRAMLRLGRLDLFNVEVQGLEVVERLVGEERGFILLGAHVGCFEVFRAVGERHCPVPVHLAMYEPSAPLLNGFLGRLAPDVRVIAIGAPDAALRVKEAVDAGGIVGILGDRAVGPGRMASTEFLGTVALVPTGPLALAAAVGAPVVLFFGLHTGHRRYRVELELLAERVILRRGARESELAGWAQRYMRAVETRCRAHPFNWFNFYDFWDPTAGAGRRPAPA
ncbi:MAG: acyltransferase [Geminicoccaceae bacterium]